MSAVGLSGTLTPTSHRLAADGARPTHGYDRRVRTAWGVTQDGLTGRCCRQGMDSLRRGAGAKGPDQPLVRCTLGGRGERSLAWVVAVELGDTGGRADRLRSPHAPPGEGPSGSGPGGSARLTRRSLSRRHANQCERYRDEAEIRGSAPPAGSSLPLGTPPCVTPPALSAQVSSRGELAGPLQRGLWR